MHALTHQRCFNHATREAVARCPECRQFYCRECVTEHEDRVICAACLKKLARVPLLKRPAFTLVLRLVQGATGLLLAWFFFYLVGAALVALPTSFHDNTLLQVNVWEKE